MNVRRTIEATTYVALSAAIGIISFLILVPTLAAGVPLLLLALAGAPLIAARVRLLPPARAAGAPPRRRPARRRVPHPRAPARGFGTGARALRWMRSRGSWLELLLRAHRAAVRRLARRDARVRRLGRRARPAQLPAVGLGDRRRDDLFGLTSATLSAVLVHVALGAGALYAAPWLARGVAAVQLAMARLLLEPGERERLTARVDTLEETRAGMVAAADAERRRIERDLHDGAQQRLVALAMTLGRAKATEDPVLAQRLRRRGPRRGQGGARRAAQPRPRHPPRRADRPRPGRRRQRARRALPGARSRSTSTSRTAPARAPRRSPTSSSPRR